MKLINLNSRLSKKENSKVGNIDYLSLWLTKRLVEKYKPKDLYNIQTMVYRKDKRRVN